MENKKDIGKAISDKLGSLDKTPRENVWSGISYELQKKKKRRIAFFFFWSRTIGLLLIGAIAALYVYNQNDDFSTVEPNNSNESIIVNGDGEKTNTNNSGNENTEMDESKSGLSNETVTDNGNNNGMTGNENRNSFENKKVFKNGKWVELSTDSRNSINAKSKRVSVKANRHNNSVSKTLKTFKNTPNTKAKGKLSKAKSTQFSKVSSKKSQKKAKEKSKAIKETSNQSDISTEQNTTALFDPKSLQNDGYIDKTKEINNKKTDSLIAKKEKEKKKTIYMTPEDKTVKDSAKTYRKFEVDAFVSPTYYGQFSDISSLDPRLDSISKKSKMTLSYGVGLTYELGEKFSIRIGYSKISLEATTKNVLINTPNYYGIKYNQNVTNQSIYNASNNAEKMDITQKMSYTEIPLELKYKFLNKKIGVTGIFGFSYLLLNENTVSIKTNNGYSQQIGKTNYIMDTSVSTNIGVGFDYEIFKNTKIFVEPMLNYQIMSFENSNPKSYFFGIHTGIRYTILNK